MKTTDPPRTDDIESLIVDIRSHAPLKRKLLRGELVRFRETLACVNAVPDGSLLDIGACGDLVPFYRERLGFSRILCLDLAQDSGPRRLQHVDGREWAFESRRVDLEREPYPLKDQTFDQVMAMEVLEHLAVDPMFMLAEANRVLKPGGRLVLTTPNIVSAASVYQQLWSRHPALGRQAFGPGIMDRHHREYTPEEVRALVEAAGFTIERLDTFTPEPLNRPAKQAAALLSVLGILRRGIDRQFRGTVIRCAAVRTSPVRERFPSLLYPRYPYYDYAAYDSELAARFGGKRYWATADAV